MILALLLLALGGATVFSAVRGAVWPGELITHFRLQMIAGAIFLAVVAMALGNWAGAIVGAGLAMLNWALMPDRKWRRPDQSAAARPGFTVVWANVWKKRVAMERTLKWAHEQNADLILLGEFPDGSIDETALASSYPYRLDAAPEGLSQDWTSRVVALSKFPLADTRILAAPGAYRRPFLVFGLDVTGGRINVCAAHPNPPMQAPMQRDRDAMIAQLQNTMKPPFVVAGDFNAAPWCVAFGRLPGERVGSLLRQTWLSSVPLLGLTIDHIFVSRDLTPSSYSVGPALGSDHRPLATRLHPAGGA